MDKVRTLRYKNVMKYLLEDSPFNPDKLNTNSERHANKNYYLIKKI
jgi:hypothetical protein